MLNVYNHWDRLTTCIVGTTYTPDFYKFVEDSDTRQLLGTLAQQTLDDLDNLCVQLRKFDVQVIRPKVTDNYLDYKYGEKILPAPLTPRDYTAVIDDIVFLPTPDALGLYRKLKGADWPDVPPADGIPGEFSVEELYYLDHTWITDIVDLATQQGNQIVYDKDVDTAMVQRLGDHLLVGNWQAGDPWVAPVLGQYFPDKQITLLDTLGHLDGAVCFISPDLAIVGPNLEQIVSAQFPDVEVYAVTPTVVKQFGSAKAANIGKYWLPDQLNSTGFQDYVENYLSHWVGEIQASCFDVNVLIVDPENVFCSSEDPKLFRLLESRGITPHVVPYRHKLFWDGGLHCVTSDLNRITRICL